jgi:hypothetical protein
MRDAATGVVVGTRADVVQAHNCGGMFRAWVDDDGRGVVSVWRETEDDEDDDAEAAVPLWARQFEGKPFELALVPEKALLPYYKIPSVGETLPDGQGRRVDCK